MLPWKEAAKHYRNKCRVARRKSERQRKELDRLYKSTMGRRNHIFKLGETINEQAAYIAELERLTEYGTEKD